ncbi:hypothetical protein MMSR116_05660 [Methylobacterium mesophilicum SR1.6/6]|uniref:Uncharacterized protein n=1 Tax=Methylobacterium mesophilicum SR1.6/6 TaxID=908290 RepID=A0A6B9FH79_9HYPH|nr:hypothetical protein MMSR116_05660 [Methylobacterium mesophilicum SR1.6/6]
MAERRHRADPARALRFHPIDRSQPSALIRFGWARDYCEGFGRPHGSRGRGADKKGHSRRSGPKSWEETPLGGLQNHDAIVIPRE